MTSDREPPKVRGRTFTETLQQNHLAQVTASKYHSNPLLLGEHYAMNFTPAPAIVQDNDDPAENSVVILLSYKPEYKSAVFGNWLIPDNMEGESQYWGFQRKIVCIYHSNLDWSQQFDTSFEATKWHVVELEIGYLRTQDGDSVDNMRWNLLVKPNASAFRVFSQITALLKCINNKKIPDEFNSFVLALEDNRPQIANK